MIHCCAYSTQRPRFDALPLLTSILCLVFALLAGCGSPAIVAPYPGNDRNHDALKQASGELSGAVTPAVAEGNGAPFLWRIKKGEVQSYLLGTVGAGIDGARDLPPSVWQALASSSNVVVRTDAWNLDAELFQKRVVRADSRFTRELDAQAWGLLRDAMEHLYPEQTLDQLHPWYVTRNLMVLLPLEAEDSLPTPIEVEVTTRAQLGGKQLVPLESWLAQIDTLEQIYGTEELVKILSALPAERERLKQLATAYRRGDLEGVSRLLYSPVDPATNGALKELWVRERLERWWAPLAVKITQGGTFVTLGLEHTLGSTGLLQRLRSAGFAVERVAN